MGAIRLDVGMVFGVAPCSFDGRQAAGRKIMDKIKSEENVRDANLIPGSLLPDLEKGAGGAH
jgi:hypothetical protein